MPKTKVYELEFKKKIVRLYLEEGRTIKSRNEEYQLGDGTVRKWVRVFREECEINPELKDTKDLYEENRKLRKELEEQKKEIAFLKKAAAFFTKEIDSTTTNSSTSISRSLESDGSCAEWASTPMPIIIIKRSEKQATACEKNRLKIRY